MFYVSMNHFVSVWVALELCDYQYNLLSSLYNRYVDLVPILCASASILLGYRNCLQTFHVFDYIFMIMFYVFHISRMLRDTYFNLVSVICV